MKQVIKYDNGNNWEPTWLQHVRNWDAEQKSKKYWETKTCSKCSRRATWYYGPSGEDRPGPYCEKHVSRGCSCNTWDGIERLDPLAREWPCSDWDWRPSSIWRWIERHTNWAPWRRRKMKWSEYEMIGDEYMVTRRLDE